MALSAAAARDEIAASLAGNSSRIVVNKASFSTGAANRLCSLWRATGQPGQGAIPTAAALCTGALLGALTFANQTAPMTSYLAWLSLTSSNNGQSVEIHDRIAHLGGLVLNVTTAQPVAGLDLATLAPTAARLGAANWSDGQWFLEVYADGGATAANATIAVTYHDGTTGTLNVQAVGGTLRAGMMLPLTPLIPTAQQGRFIRGITSVILSASTGTAGNFGFTATRPRSALPLNVTNKGETWKWDDLGMPEIANDSCLMLMVLPVGTTSGILRGSGKIIHG